MVSSYSRGFMLKCHSWFQKQVFGERVLFARPVVALLPSLAGGFSPRIAAEYGKGTVSTSGCSGVCVSHRGRSSSVPQSPCSSSAVSS